MIHEAGAIERGLAAGWEAHSSLTCRLKCVCPAPRSARQSRLLCTCTTAQYNTDAATGRQEGWKLVRSADRTTFKIARLFQGKCERPPLGVTRSRRRAADS